MSSKIVTALKTIDYKDVAERAAWTFVQSFLGVYLLASEQLVELAFSAEWNVLWTLFLATGAGALGAGLSALKTVIISVIKEVKKKSV